MCAVACRGDFWWFQCRRAPSDGARGCDSPRIVDAAAQLMATRGVAATTLDDVRAASGTSKSRYYHHFENKDALVHAVVQQQGEQVLELNARGLSRLNSMRGLELWRNALLEGDGPQRRLRVRARGRWLPSCPMSTKMPGSCWRACSRPGNRLLTRRLRTDASKRRPAR